MGCICYLAGYQAANKANEKALVESGAVTHRCFSFVNLVPLPGLPYYLKGTEEGYKVCVKNGVGIMMDSGVFSFRTHRKRLIKDRRSVSLLPTEEEYVQMYVDFCRRNAHKWDFYVTIDFTVNSEENFKRHVRLEKMGIHPVPVIHGDANMEEYLRRYHERGYDYICLGTSKSLRTGTIHRRRYMANAFEIGARYGIEFHGLAVTTPWQMLEFPWKSVDSSTWSRSAGYGNILRFNDDSCRLDMLHLTHRVNSKQMPLYHSKVFEQRIRRELEDEGYNFDDLQTSHLTRHIYNARTMTHLAAAAGSHYRNQPRFRALV